MIIKEEFVWFFIIMYIGGDIKQEIKEEYPIEYQEVLNDMPFYLRWIK